MKLKDAAENRKRSILNNETISHQLKLSLFLIHLRRQIIRVTVLIKYWKLYTQKMIGLRNINSKLTTQWIGSIGD